jgi:dihydroorotate dehydrogenase
MYKLIARPILFRFQPETAHAILFRALKIIQVIPGGLAVTKLICNVKQKPVEVFGLTFPNPVGLAAGLDKDADAYDMLGAMGFGFVEIGTITPKAQPGNPKPRLFRLKKDNAIINRMGFNNLGVEHAVTMLKKKRSNVIIGGNLGKNKTTPNEDAVNDYNIGFEALYPYVDYFVVNVSSPNTPNLRELQDKAPLKALLLSLQSLNAKKVKSKPILLKIAPDLTDSQLDDIIEIVTETKIAGLVATNTTISRNNVSYSDTFIESIGNGGLSGKPLKTRSTEVIRYLSEKSKGSIPIIGVGGIMTAQDAKDKLEAGACLVQLYTGFIYEGTGLIKEIVNSL